MAHNPILWGYRIYLDRTATTDASVGLYGDEIRWIESNCTMTATPSTWCSSMLAEVEPHVQAGDFRQGGAVASADGETLHFINTDQFTLLLSAYGISLAGLRCEKYEFVWAEATGEVSRAIVFTGVLGDPQWNETTCTVPMTTAEVKRRSFLGTVINNDGTYGNYPSADAAQNGAMVPLTFGEIDRAKMVRTAKKETVLTNDAALGFTAGTLTPPGLKQFPVVSDHATAVTTYTVQVCLSSAVSAGPLTNLEGAYIKVVQGAGSGQIRRIASADILTSSTISVTVAAYFKNTLQGNSTATKDNNSWVEIFTVAREYGLDTWPCKAFTDGEASPTEISTQLELSSFTAPQSVSVSGSSETVPVDQGNKGYYPLPHYAYAEVAGTDHNSVEIDANLFNGSPDTINCPRIVRPHGYDISLPVDATLADWGFPSAVKVAGCPGLYTTLTGTPTVSLDTSPAADWADALDRDFGTYEESKHTLTSLGKYYHVTVIKTPEPPADFDFDNLLLSMTVEHYKPVGVWESPIIRVMSRKFTGTPLSVYEKNISNIGGGGNLACPNAFRVFTTPDFDMDPYGPYGDIYYYVDEYNNVSVGSFFAHQYGAQNFEIDSTDAKSGALYEVAIITEFNVYHIPLTTFVPVEYSARYYELAFAYVKKVSIQDAVFSGIRGRVFDDTWGTPTRKTATDLMTSPVDVVEHVLRLQNWADIGDNESWGHTYSPNARIKLSDAGSFDDTTNLGPSGATLVKDWLPGDLSLARQVLDASDAYSDVLLKSLTATTFCTLYKDANGYECLRFLPAIETPATAITLSDVIGQIGAVQEPEAKDIFCQPFVRYAMNYGSEKFDNEMRVLNVNDPDGTGWVPTYTPGLNETGHMEVGMVDGEVIWNECNSLYTRFRQLETPPNELTDLVWFRTYHDALWYLYQWVKWQGKKRIAFAVPYSLGKDWYISKHITINFPHQTNGQALECVVEKLTKDKNAVPSVVHVGLIMLQNPTSADAYQGTDAGSVTVYQDTDAGSVPVWQDTDSTME